MGGLSADLVLLPPRDHEVCEFDLHFGRQWLAVIGTEDRNAIVANERSRYCYSYKGTALAAIGLCEQTKFELLELNRPIVSNEPET